MRLVRAFLAVLEAGILISKKTSVGCARSKMRAQQQAKIISNGERERHD